jgi:hypothetical protein
MLAAAQSLEKLKAFDIEITEATVVTKRPPGRPLGSKDLRPRRRRGRPRKEVANAA